MHGGRKGPNVTAAAAVWWWTHNEIIWGRGNFSRMG